jgi:Mn-dependent DtxR family transcriptional regulator
MLQETKEKKRIEMEQVIMNAIRALSAIRILTGNSYKEIGISDIAAFAAKSYPTVTRTLRALEAQGLVELELTPYRGARITVELKKKE